MKKLLTVALLCCSCADVYDANLLDAAPKFELNDFSMPPKQSRAATFVVASPKPCAGVEITPTADLRTVCANFGGVVFAMEDARGYRLMCKATGFAYLRLDAGSDVGDFTVVTDTCEAQYVVAVSLVSDDGGV